MKKIVIAEGVMVCSMGFHGAYSSATTPCLHDSFFRITCVSLQDDSFEIKITQESYAKIINKIKRQPKFPKSTLPKFNLVLEEVKEKK